MPVFCSAQPHSPRRGACSFTTAYRAIEPIRSGWMRRFGSHLFSAEQARPGRTSPVRLHGRDACCIAGAFMGGRRPPKIGGRGSEDLLFFAPSLHRGRKVARPWPTRSW